jgi:hypothetical protein
MLRIIGGTRKEKQEDRETGIQPQGKGYISPLYIRTPQAVYPPRSSPDTAAAAAREPIVKT